MGPRAISTWLVRNRPEVLPASRARRRYRSAQSGTLIRGGGVMPRRHAALSRSRFASLASEFRNVVAELGEVLLDIFVQALRHHIRRHAEIGSQQGAESARPGDRKSTRLNSSH